MLLPATKAYFRQLLINRARMVAAKMQLHLPTDRGNAFFPPPLRFVAQDGFWKETIDESQLEDFYEDLIQSTAITTVSPDRQRRIVDRYIQKTVVQSRPRSCAAGKLAKDGESHETGTGTLG